MMFVVGFLNVFYGLRRFPSIPSSLWGFLGFFVLFCFWFKSVRGSSLLFLFSVGFFLLKNHIWMLNLFKFVLHVLRWSYFIFFLACYIVSYINWHPYVKNKKWPPWNKPFFIIIFLIDFWNQSAKSFDINFSLWFYFLCRVWWIAQTSFIKWAGK